MKFSICIPTYEAHGKGGLYLGELFESLAQQTCKDFEVIISDQAKDGSIKTVCDKWNTKFKINYLPFQHEHGKASKNLNNAMRHATGDVIKVIDLDDFLFSPECLQKIQDVLEKNPKAQWGVCGYVHTDQDRRAYFRYKIPKYNTKILYARNTMGNPTISFFRKSSCLELDENLKWMNDCELYYRLNQKYGHPLIIPETLVAVRIGEHQVTNKEVNRQVQTREIMYSLTKHGKSVPLYKASRFLKRAKGKFKSLTHRFLSIPVGMVWSDINAWVKKEDALTKLANRYNSDKGTRKMFSRDGDRHFYTPIYHKRFEHLRNKEMVVLEIGVGTGYSLGIWPRYFHKANIYVLDIDDFSKHNKKRLVCLKGDQSNRTDLEKAMKLIGSKIDLIIEDGGHYMNQQQISLGFLFPYLKPGGLYIIEDLCTSYWPYKGQIFVYNNIPIDTNEDKSNSTVSMIKDYLHTKSIRSQYLLPTEIEYLNQNIEKCELVDTPKNQYGPNHLAFFTKKHD